MNDSATYEVVLGVDVGGTGTAFGLVDRAGRCHAQGAMATDSHQPPEQFFQRLFEQVAALQAGLAGHPVLVGLGFGAPNANHHTGAIVHPPNLHWEFVDLPAQVHPYYELPVAVTNDANAVALGEHRFGAARGMRDFIAITLGTGVGGAIVANGAMVYGVTGMAAELGHTTAVPGGRECGCGRLGCLEAYASASGIQRTAAELLAQRRAPSTLRALAYDELTSLRLCQEALGGDALAREAFTVTGRILGAKLADSVLHTSPEAIILFGGVAAAGDLLFLPTALALEENLPLVFQGRVRLLPSGLPGADAAILGAAALGWTQLAGTAP